MDDALKPGLLIAAAAGLAAGGVLYLASLPAWSSAALAAGTLAVLAALLVQIARSIAKRDFALDIVAALAMGGALLLGEVLAGAVVALMFAGGQVLEARAGARARREMTALLARQPRSALRQVDGRLEEIPIAALAPGDHLLVRRGEVLPADGVLAAPATLDESALTGEPLPVAHPAGAAVRSGTTNAGDSVLLVASRPAAASSYAAILRMVEQAASAKPPMARLAESWSVAFLLATLALSGGAWLATGDPLRALAVLVVATPCPLLLAVPVALVAGLNRAARAGVMIKSGAALEALAQVSILVLDKTGTLTEGTPSLVAIRPAPGFTEAELLRLAAALDQASGHVLAAALVQAAQARGLVLPTPTQVAEAAGAGLAGLVEGRRVALGARPFVATHATLPPATTEPPGTASVQVAVEGRHAGTLLFRDALRPDAAAMVAAARRAGITRVVLLSGDDQLAAEAAAGQIGADAVFGNHDPAQKMAAIASERRRGRVLMVGDGVNDAPALALADVGIAMAARGQAASSEAADAIILVDRLDRVALALVAARRARGIARQSVAAGLGLSALGMIAAAFGYLTPVQGALLQEAIDVAVVLNALRSLGPGRNQQGNTRA
ncbi:heavy metal translocating P-type ATPase [Falsiroseomonas sp. HC035]|uniref:heavy metal translocating P-type ATPase n=1 Tax=Falsiroseomonas sp. HC035 TaxID=3390999 RepID=UPI003D318CF8